MKLTIIIAALITPSCAQAPIKGCKPAVRFTIGTRHRPRGMLMVECPSP